MIRTDNVELPAGSQPPVSRQGRQWEVVSVEGVLQVEDPREARAGVVVFFPGAVGGLVFDQPVDAAFYGRVVRAGDGHHAHDAPGGLARGAVAGALQTRVLVAVAGLAPTAVGLLAVAQPVG